MVKCEVCGATFDEALGKSTGNPDERMEGNALIEKAIDRIYEEPDSDNLIDFLTVLCIRMKADGCGLVPFVTVGEGVFPDLDVYSLQEGDTITLDHEVGIRMDTVTEGDGKEWFYIFTNGEEMHKKPVPDVVMEIPFAEILEAAKKSNKVNGVVMNPFGKYFKLDKKLIECTFEVLKHMEE